MDGLYSLVRHAQMQYRYEIEHASAMLALRREGLYSLIQHAQKQYRYEIEHAPANFALQRY